MSAPDLKMFVVSSVYGRKRQSDSRMVAGETFVRLARSFSLTDGFATLEKSLVKDDQVRATRDGPTQIPP
jgi:hypothetical protein